MANPFFCISYFEGDIAWAESISDSNYVIYAKGDLPANAPKNAVPIPNVGYNIYSYLTYIIEHYDSLPELIVFARIMCSSAMCLAKRSKRFVRGRFSRLSRNPGAWTEFIFPRPLFLVTAATWS